MNISKRRSEEAVHSHKKRLLGRQIVARPCRTLVLTDSQKSSGALETLPGTSCEAEELENDFLGYFRTAHEKTDQPMNLSFAPTSDTGGSGGEFLTGSGLRRPWGAQNKLPLSESEPVLQNYRNPTRFP